MKAGFTGILLAALCFPTLLLAAHGSGVSGYNFVTYSRTTTFGKSTGYNYGPTVIHDDDGVYKMWWTSNAPTDGCGGTNDTIWNATSTDGTHWTNSRVAVTAAPYHLLVADPSVVKVNGTYYLYYTGTSDLRNNGVNSSVFVSTSTDAINWTPVATAAVPLPNPDPNGVKYGIGQPTVVYRPDLGKVQIWFTWTSGPYGQGMYYSESSNPLQFPTSNTLVFYNEVAAEIKYVSNLGVYVMAFQHYGGSACVLFNVSPNGWTWAPDAPDCTAKAELYNDTTGIGQPAMSSDSKGWISGSTFLYSNDGANTGNLCSWKLIASTLNIYQIPANALYRFEAGAPYNDRYYNGNPTNPNSYYSYAGLAAQLFPNGTGSTGPLYELYKSSTVKHLYTSSWAEVTSAQGSGYTYDGPVAAGSIALSQISGTTPYYRLRQTTINEYLYTASWPEANNAIQTLGYVLESSPGYVLPPANQQGNP